MPLLLLKKVNLMTLALNFKLFAHSLNTKMLIKPKTLQLRLDVFSKKRLKLLKLLNLAVDVFSRKLPKLLKLLNPVVDAFSKKLPNLHLLNVLFPTNQVSQVSVQFLKKLRNQAKLLLGLALFRVTSPDPLTTFSKWLKVWAVARCSKLHPKKPNKSEEKLLA
jgi:hypothetical protein